MAVTLEGIRAAADALGDAIVRTPCLRSQTLSEITGAEVWLKFENLQFTASFKERGARTVLASLGSEARARGVVAMSAGNHAQAVARHAALLGISAAVVMPRFTPNVKVEHTRAFGADVELCGDSLEEAGARAREIERDEGRTLIHPYDDERVIVGQGTVALEMLEVVPDLDVLIVPIGGGGLIAGNAVAAKSLRPGIEVIGVETERFPSMEQALRGVPPECGRTTIADGIAVKQPGRLTLPLVREHVDGIVLVGELEIERAVLLLLEIEKTVVEGAGAVGLAALLAGRERFVGRRVGLVLSGGNVDMLSLSSIIQRGLVRTQRMVRLRVEIEDRPGALADVARAIADADGNVVAVQHQRAFTSSPLKAAEVEFVLQTRGPEHVGEILEALDGHGYQARVDDAPQEKAT